MFPQLPPGTYSLAATAAGFKKLEKNDLVLPVASKISVGDLEMTVGSLSARVTVEAEAGQLQLQAESGERSNLITNRQLRDIGEYNAARDMRITQLAVKFYF